MQLFAQVRLTAGLGVDLVMTRPRWKLATEFFDELGVEFVALLNFLPYKIYGFVRGANLHQVIQLVTVAKYSARLCL